MSENHTTNVQVDARHALIEGVNEMNHTEMHSTLGGDGGTLLEEWKALCAKYPDSAPCKGRRH